MLGIPLCLTDVAEEHPYGFHGDCRLDAPTVHSFTSISLAALSGTASSYLLAESPFIANLLVLVSSSMV